MSPLRNFPPLVPRLCSNLLPFFAACALLLVASGFNVMVGTRTLVQSWQNRLVNHVLVTLPHSSSPEQTDSPSEKETLLQLLHNIPQGRDVKIMTRGEISHLMTQWGGSWTASYPLVASLTYNGDRQVFEKTIKQTFPQAMVIFPPDMMQWLPGVIKPLQLASGVVSFFLIFTGEAIFALSFVLSLSHGWQKHLAAIKILFYSGCPERVFWHSVRRQTGWRCLVGGYAGLIMMIPLLNSVASILRPVLHLPAQPDGLSDIFFHNPFGPFLTVILLLWPLLNCLAGWGIATCFFRHPSSRFYV